MDHVTERGDHDYVDTINDPSQIHDAAYLAKDVYDAEKAAVDKRREFINEEKIRNRRNCDWTGLAFSGGGIRSASFGLGVLQALQAKHENRPIYGIEGIDYLSTVSGGGYIGCSLTAALQKAKGKFPFTNPNNYDDTDSVRHIRDYSNYLIPHGALDVATAIGIIGRGLVANTLIILPVLLLCVCITLLIHPNADSLGKPVFFAKYLIETFPGIPLLPTLHGYWFTLILGSLNLLFLFLWVLWTSMNLGKAATLRGGWVGASKFFFLATLVTAFFETQPFILWVINEAGNSAGQTGSSLPQWLHRSHNTITTYFASVGAILGSMGTVFALLSKYLSDIVALAKRSTGWLAWFKKFAALAALWLAGLVVPVLLWLIYLWLVYIGLGRELALPSYLAAFVISTFVALFIDPNRTSLFRLYRDRLSKAFLFDPDGHFDEFGDLQPYEPKLYDIDPRYGPYPIVNAALNIEASQYANKRGRNADFFVFTPEYTGSGATGYIGSRRIKKDAVVLALGTGSGGSVNEKRVTALDLGTAMAISGAAVSSNMGALTVKALTFTLALFNFRLGYWLRNPNPECIDPPTTKRLDWIVAKLFRLPSFVLFAEMFSWITEKSPKVYLTDGGHIENLGVYSLMKRRCKVIIAVDAEADPTMSFGALLNLERCARIDLGATIDLPWKEIRDCTLRLDKAIRKANKGVNKLGVFMPCEPGPHCAACEIQYGPDKANNGVLLYIKASLSGDEPDYVLDYKRRYPDFPHETTGDQFFGEEQLEAYRALAFHIMKNALTDEQTIAVKGDATEDADAKRQRILGTLRAALLGSELSESHTRPQFG